MSSAGQGKNARSPARIDQYRPRTIAELATIANENLWDSSKPLKHWLRTAEKARKVGNAFVESREYELAFIQFARAATLVLEKLPSHKEYQSLLSSAQRSNLGLVSMILFLEDHSASIRRWCSALV